MIDRLEGDTDAPLDIFGLEKRLQVLQMDDRIQRIDAKLRPGEKKGEAILSAKVKENKLFKISFNFDNYQPPTVGDYRGVLTLSHANVFGFGDRLLISGSKTNPLDPSHPEFLNDGFMTVNASYSVSRNPMGYPARYLLQEKLEHGQRKAF